MNRRDEVSDFLCQYASEEILPDEAIAKLDRIYGVMPDDGELATYEWMGKAGADVDRDEDNIYLNYGGGFFMSIHVEITRYQFRRLCEALGVELQERKDGE